MRNNRIGKTIVNLCGYNLISQGRFLVSNETQVTSSATKRRH
jgi:hypothetical protein